MPSMKIRALSLFLAALLCSASAFHHIEDDCYSCDVRCIARHSHQDHDEHKDDGVRNLRTKRNVAHETSRRLTADSCDAHKAALVCTGGCNPWGEHELLVAQMNSVFADWDEVAILGASPTKVELEQYDVIYIEGGESLWEDTAAWLVNGGNDALEALAATTSILINTAPNNGPYIFGDLPFGANFTRTLTDSVTVSDFPTNPLTADGFVQPTAEIMTGNYFAHGQFFNGPYTPLLVGTSDPSRMILAQGTASSVLLGGMTTSNFHLPIPHGGNFALNVLEYLCKIHPQTAGGKGDPHIKTWSGEMYDFHGACDLVLLQNPAYGRGLGMDIHIRTKFTRQWSYIDAAVLRIGEETLEVRGGVNANSYYWINRVGNGDLKNGISGFPISVWVHNNRQREIKVDLGSGQIIVFKTWKDFVRVDVAGARVEDFGSSLGLMGNWKGQKIGRDNTTLLEEMNIFGQEWQVLAQEPKLFHKLEGTQAPQKCTLPDVSKGRRRLRESALTVEDAEIACSRVSKEDRDACIFDVLAIDDKDAASAY